MRAIFEPLKYLTVEQLDRIDPWTCCYFAAKLDLPPSQGCIFEQAFNTSNFPVAWRVQTGLAEDEDQLWSLIDRWDYEQIPRQELADAIAECKERLRVPVFEEVELV